MTFGIRSKNAMPLNPLIIKVCRELRRNQTPAERVLWCLLRNRKLKHLKFLRQHPFVFGGTRSRPQFYVVDFYCAEKRLVVELDGEIHRYQVDYDKERSEILYELGLRVLRIGNEELVEPSKVLNKVLEAANSPPSPLSTS